MLTITFSHRYLKMPPGFNPAVDKTYLLDYCVQDVLPQEFIDYDTTIGEPGHHPGHPTKRFALHPTGPYLILFLATICPPGNIEHDWTMVRCPWRMGFKQCVNDRSDAICDMNCRSIPFPDWPTRCIEFEPNIPAKYREARGKEVRIKIEEVGHGAPRV